MDRHRNGDPHLRISDGPRFDGSRLHRMVPTDAVVSRTKSNWKTGISLIEATGAQPTCVEAVLFDL